MQTVTKILEHLQQLPDSFREHFTQERWSAAAMDYEHALVVSRFIRMDEEARLKLIEQFDTEQVQEAYKKAGRWKEDADGKGDREEAVRAGRHVQTLLLPEGVLESSIVS